MSPHRMTSVRCYRISNDVLITILEYLDPPTLWRVCKAFQRVYMLVMEYNSLRYKYELALSGMKDGPAAYSRAPPISRLQLLLTYRKDWPRLAWTHECKLQIPMPAQVGFSGGFIHQIHAHGAAYSTLELTELPSCRTSRPPTHTRHLKFTTTAIESVAVEHLQALVVTCHVFNHQGQIGLQLHFRDLWTFGKHPRACALSYEFSTQVAVRAVRLALMICGSKLAVSIDFSGGRVKHLIMNWHTFDARWLDDQDVQFLDETYLLGLNKKAGTALLSLYNVSKVSSVSVIREFELPESWANTITAFCPNSSPRSDFSLPSDALFYAAPETRVLAITARPIPNSHLAYAPICWLFLKESYFRYPSRRDAFRVPWRQWGQYCLIKEISGYPGAVRGPCVVGTKVFYAEATPGRVHTSTRGAASTSSSRSTRLHVVDFSLFSGAGDSARGWTSIGPRAGLVPNENSRPIPSSSVDNLAVEDIKVTEDNIVLFLEARHGFKLANVMTFGTPTSGTTRSTLRY